jgi:Dolichyl-phosphate-mannose-protein mannosyltransferase
VRSIALVVLLATFVLAGGVALRSDSATFDETPHVGDGLAILDRADFRLNPEHPPLLKMWAAMPLHAKRLALPDYASAAWQRGDQWTFGFETLNGPRSAVERRDPMLLLVPARAMVLGLGVLLGVLVWAWSRSLFGPNGGLVSAFLFALSPTMLAHAHLVTTDLAAALGFVLSVTAFRRYLMAPSLTNAIGAGLATGIALLVKFSTLVLGPILLVLAAVQVAFPHEGATRKRVFGSAVRGLVAVAVLSVASIWSAYQFRYAASPDSTYTVPWDARAQLGHGIPSAISFLREHRLLPEAYLFGLTASIQDAKAESYLNGEVSDEGWAWYFPEALALKTPPAFLALAALALLVGLRHARLRAFTAACLVVPVVVYAVSCMTSGLNLGHRHLVPIEPFLFVACGSLVAVVDQSRRRRWIAGALLAGYAVSFAFATPRYLTYFNAFAGGRAGGGRYLLDSNLDWGQDLIRLKRWMSRHGETEIALAYFGTGDPQAYGIRWTKIVWVRDFRPEEPALPPPSGSLVAVSENFLHGLYVHDDGGSPDRSAGAWIRELPRRATVVGRAGDSLRIYRLR